MGKIADFRTAASELVERVLFARVAGLAGFGGRRKYYDALGYDLQITTQQYREEYARGGIAKRIVEAYPNATWRGGVELYEDEDPKNITEFEKIWKEHLEGRLNIWSVLRRADILAGLSTYSVILIGDGKNISSELSKGSPEKLLYLQPYIGGGAPVGIRSQQTRITLDGDCTIAEWDTDPRSPRFGEPQTYHLNQAYLAQTNMNRDIHWSRIIHIAEGGLEDNIFGPPTLENVWNLLQDLIKVTGGGAEAFWLRANQGLNLNLDKDITMDTTDQQNLLKEVEEYRHDLSRVLKTRGMDVNVLGSDVANFGQPADAILKQISGSKGIPMRILTGSEMGELASSQDAENWNSQVQDRRTNYAGPLIVRKLVDRLIEYGYLPTPTKYEVGWPVEEEMTEPEKADLAVKLATVNQTYGDLVFTEAEIREKCFDLKPLTDEQKAVVDARAEEKLKRQQEAMAAMAPKASPDEEEEPFQRRAAEDDELARILQDAIAANATEVIDEILGVKRG